MTITVPSVAGLPTVSNVFGLASGNPYLAGFQMLSSLFGGGKVDISKGGAGGFADSGSADFFGQNSLKLKKPVIDLTSPVNVALTAAVLVGAVYVYKKYLR